MMSRALISAGLLVVLGIVMLPVIWVLQTALQKDPSLSAALELDKFSLEHFSRFLLAEDTSGRWVFGHQLKNSLLASILTTLFGVSFAASSAYALSRFSFFADRIVAAAFVVSQMFPGVMMMIPLYYLFDQLNLLNSSLGLVFVYTMTSLPFSVLMLKGYFDTIPKELDEAAVMDGASHFFIFRKIMIPLARPALAVTALFSFMTAWNEFIVAATLLDEETTLTLPVALQRAVGDFSTDWGLFAAGALIVSLPVVTLFFVLQKHLVGGLTAGGVKGS